MRLRRRLPLARGRREKREHRAADERVGEPPEERLDVEVTDLQRQRNAIEPPLARHGREFQAALTEEQHEESVAAEVSEPYPQAPTEETEHAPPALTGRRRARVLVPVQEPHDPQVLD